MSDSEVITKQCGRCKSVPKDYLKCIICEAVMHFSCAKLSKKVKIINEKDMNCCEATKECSQGSEPTLLSDDPLLVEIYYLKELLKHKDEIINCQKLTIDSLTQQLSIINNNKNIKNPNINSTKATESQNNNKNLQKIPAKNKIGENKIPSTDIQVIKALNKPIESGAASLAILEAKSVAVCDQIINLSKDNIKKPSVKANGDWTTVVNKNKKKSKTSVVGNLINSSKCTLKVVPKKSFVYVTRLDPSTKCDNIVDYLKATFPEIKCESLISKFPTSYSSFKLTVDVDNFEKVMNPDLWPQGTYLDKFYHPRSNIGTKIGTSDKANKTEETKASFL